MDQAPARAPAPVLSHIEAVYRPGERQLAIDLFQTIGCRTCETETKSPAGSTYISVHPDPDDRGFDNVLYLSEMPRPQHELEEILQRRMAQDDELAEARTRYRSMADTQPFGLSHIAVRYPSFEALERVLDGLEERLSPELRSRVALKVFRPGDEDDHATDSIQAFLYTDLAVAGISTFGQVFELAAYAQANEAA